MLIHQDVYEEVMERVAEEAKNIKIGPEMCADTTMGPLVSREQQEKVMNYIRSGEQAGARILTGGKAGSMQSDCYVEPTVFDNVNPDMKIVAEEIFGPVVVAAPFEDLDAVIVRGNDTEYGLAASVWTKISTRLIKWRKDSKPEQYG